MEQTIFTTHQIGKICGVTMQTVIDWEKQGKLTAYKTLGGHRRVKKEDLISFLKKNKFPIPDELANSPISRNMGKLQPGICFIALCKDLIPRIPLPV